MACFVAMRYGASTKALEEDFLVDDVAWRVTRMALMDFWHLTPDQIDALRNTPVVMDMLLYMSAKGKAAQK